MGSAAEAVAGSRELLDVVRRRVDSLESLWSTFRPGSEVSRANARPGERMPASPETVLLVSRAAALSDALDGWFDPCLLGPLVGAGYTHSRDDPAVPRVGPGGTCAGAGALAWGEDWISVPPNGFDPGGIGKGLAADLAVREALAAGATSVAVSLGGDLACAGNDGNDDWEVETVTERPGLPRALWRLGSGGLATSTPLRRTWTHEGRPAHHLLNPRTGHPAAHPPAAVTVLADDTHVAEAASTALSVSADSRYGDYRHSRGLSWDDVLTDLGALAVVLHGDGRVDVLGDPARRGALRIDDERTALSLIPSERAGRSPSGVEAAEGLVAVEQGSAAGAVEGGDRAEHHVVGRALHDPLDPAPEGGGGVREDRARGAAHPGAVAEPLAPDLLALTGEHPGQRLVGLAEQVDGEGAGGPDRPGDGGGAAQAHQQLGRVDRDRHDRGHREPALQAVGIRGRHDADLRGELAQPLDVRRHRALR
jgi:FAD:protein FMN transferase